MKWKAHLPYMISMPSSDLLHSITRLYPLKSTKTMIYIYHKPFAIHEYDLYLVNHMIDFAHLSINQWLLWPLQIYKETAVTLQPG